MQRIADKIDVYDLQDKGTTSDPVDVNSPLYRGLAKYKETYQAKVQHYATKYGAVVSKEAFTNQHFFREQYARFVTELNADEAKNAYTGEPSVREQDPKKAATKMKALFGKQGTTLYQLALEEEMNSVAYMDAVYHQSKEHIAGEKWAERPVVLVAGPSASGKSYAVNCAMKEATRFLAKEEGNNEGNEVVFVDGAIAREVSQVRKLAIVVANNKGFTGISDLQRKSSMLDKVKDRVYHFAKDHTSHGLVIPETFSFFINPFDRTRRMLKEIIALPNAKPLFVRVVGKEPSNFKKVVAYMGSSRALKMNNFDEKRELNPNEKSTSESKFYGASGFRWGVFGSKLAEKWFNKHSQNNHIMQITNDLVLKRENPPASNQWVDAVYGEKGVVLVSARIFKAWQEDSVEIGLKEYMEKHKAPPLINTTAEIQIAIISDIIEKQLKQNMSSIYHVPITKENREAFYKLSDLKKKLDTVNLKDPHQIADLIIKLHESLPAIKKAESQKDIFKILKTLDKTLKLLYQDTQVASPPVRMIPSDVKQPSHGILKKATNFIRKYSDKILHNTSEPPSSQSPRSKR